MMNRTIIIFLALLCIFFTSFQTAYSSEDVPSGQSSETTKKASTKGITADVFGDKGGYFHPFISLETVHTSNLFFTHGHEDKSFITTIAPGIWLALPESREKLLNISTSPSTPGGIEFSHMQADKSRRMQTYFLYSPSFVYYSGFSKYNHTNHTAEGFFNYNFGFDVSLELFDQYNIRSDINDDGLGKKLDEYYDNIATIVASYEPSPKLKFRFDFSNYITRFDKNVNQFRDRKDNSIAAYVFYKFMPKTSVFMEYERTYINYDNRSNDDSIENRYYAGIDWEISAKSKGQVKGGYIEKKFDKNNSRDEEDFSLEAQIQHAITPKSSVLFSAFQKYHETTLPDSYFIRTRGISSAFLLRFTQKWSGAINASYTRERYEGSGMHGAIDERDDDIFGIGPAIKFDAKKWLVFEAGYHYTTRNSNYSIYDYDNEMIYLRMKIDL